MIIPELFHISFRSVSNSSSLRYPFLTSATHGTVYSSVLFSIYDTLQDKTTVLLKTVKDEIYCSGYIILNQG